MRGGCGSAVLLDVGADQLLDIAHLGRDACKLLDDVGIGVFVQAQVYRAGLFLRELRNRAEIAVRGLRHRSHITFR